MGLKARIRLDAVAEGHAGFRFPSPPTTRFGEARAFRDALVQQRDHLALLDAAKVLKAVDADGCIDSTAYRLTSAAFGDLCAVSTHGTTGLPSRWCRQLAARNEALALEVLHDHIAEHLSGADRQLVIDTATNFVLGLVGATSYHLIHNVEILDLVLSVPGFTFTNGWLVGGRIRLTCVRDGKVIEPQKGDIVRTGVNCENAVNGDRGVHVTDYAERLVCTNGMVRPERQHAETVLHSDAGIHHRVPKAIVAAAKRSEAMRPLIERAAKLHLDAEGHKKVGAYIQSPQQGGNPRLLEAATKAAQVYAVRAGREDDDLTLWDYANGVTEAAHAAPSLTRRTELEVLGFRLLEQFAAGRAS